jgi:hypothetical protein
VLLVDGPLETRDVLAAVFQPRGVAVERVRSTVRDRAASPLPVPPRVVVLHGESAAGSAWGDVRDVPRIFIGRTSLGRNPGCTASEGSDLPQTYEYRDLVRAIESALDDGCASRS